MGISGVWNYVGQRSQDEQKVRRAISLHNRFNEGLSSLSEVEQFANLLIEIDTEKLNFARPKVEVQPFGKGCVCPYDFAHCVHHSSSNKIFVNRTIVQMFLDEENMAADFMLEVGHELTHAKQNAYIKNARNSPSQEVKMNANKLHESLLRGTSGSIQVFKNVVQEARSQSKKFDAYASQFDNLSKEEKERGFRQLYRSFAAQELAEENARQGAIEFVENMFDTFAPFLTLKDKKTMQKERFEKVEQFVQDERDRRKTYCHYQNFVKELADCGFKFDFEIMCINNLISAYPILVQDKQSTATMSCEVKLSDDGGFDYFWKK